MPETSSKKSAAMDPALPEKKRGRRRLIGALALFVGAAVILSIVFDHEPKPVSPDLQLKIPPRDKSPVAVAAPTDPNQAIASNLPVAVTVPTETAPPKTEIAAQDTGKAADAIAPTASGAPVPAAVKPELAKETAIKAVPQKVEPKVETKVEPKAEKPATQSSPKSEDDPIAKLTEQSKAGNKPGSSGSFMVQIGAFSSEEKLEAARAKAKSAGFKTVTEKVVTTNGERTRLRVGPFSDRAAAAAARDKLKSEGLEPALIAL